MNNSLLILSISPVQTFISQAKKTQDFYGGSTLLSHLIKHVIEKLPGGSNLIFPADTESVPNRLISILNLEKDQAKSFGEKIEKEVWSELEKTFENAFNNNGQSIFLSSAIKIKINSQLENFLQIFWATVTYSEDVEETYKSYFDRLENHFRALKNIRTFKQISEDGKKCSLCGERSFIFCEQNSKLARENSTNQNIVKMNGISSENEGLCAVCFTKRFHCRQTFPSTAKVALVDTICRLETDSEAKRCIQDYKNSFGSKFDYQLFYEENLTESYFKKNNISDFANKAALTDIKEKLRKIKDKVREKEIKFENKYYAIVMMDSDDLGKWISGEFLKDKRDLQNFQKILSGTKLKNYAQNINNMFQDNSCGKIVYSGGDDIMAFVNLNHFLELVPELRRIYPAFEQIAINGTTIAQPTARSTASAGITIAHYKSPLSEVIKSTRSILEEAKKIKGKDSVGISLMTHSGNTITSVCKWRHLDIIKNLILSSDEFSYNFVFSFKNEMFPTFKASTWRYKDIDYIYSIITLELKRMISRMSKGYKSEEKVNEIINKICNETLKDFICFNINEYDSEYIFDISNFNAIFEVSRFLAKEINVYDRQIKTD